MTKYETAFPHPFPLEPGGEPGLSESWRDGTLDDRVEYLRRQHIYTRPETFVAAVLETTAARMDIRNEAQGWPPLHLNTLTEQWHGPSAARAYNEGMSEHITSYETLDAPGRFICSKMEICFGQTLINPRMLNDVLGRNRSTGYVDNTKTPLLSQGVHRAMEAEEWSDELVGLAGAQFVRQAASKAAKGIVASMLCPDDELPRTKNEAEAVESFWRTKLAGTEQSLGIAYFLGSRDKISPVMVDRMKSIWGDTYSDNRYTFTTALNIRHVPNRPALQKQTHAKLRRPVFALIQQGKFEEARELMATVARADETRQFFSPLGLRYLLGPDFYYDADAKDS